MSNSVLILQKQDVLEKQKSEIQEVLGEFWSADNIFFISPEDAVEKIEGVEILIAPPHPAITGVLEKNPQINWIHFLSAGVEPIWAMPFDKTRYYLTKSSGVHARPMAEFAVGAVLHFLKDFGGFTRKQLNKQWQRRWLDECEGKTLGIIGMGAIGTRVAEIAANLGLRVVGTVHGQPREVPSLDTLYSHGQIDQLLMESDFVLLLVPLTSETKGLLTATHFDLMKSDSVLINLARGGVVAEGDLIDALKENKIGGAALDVFEDEPLPEDSPLWEMDNVLITPHVSGTTQYYLERALSIFKQNYNQFMYDGSFVTPVDKEKKY